MNRFRERRRALLAGLLTVTALAGAAPAQAHRVDCETRLERLEARFYEIADRRGYEAATEWWQKAWARYYERCGG